MEPGKTSLTSQLPPAPAHRHNAHDGFSAAAHHSVGAHAQQDADHDDGHDHELEEDEALDNTTEAGDREEQAKRDDEKPPRAKASGIGDGSDSSDHRDSKPKRRRRRGGRGRKRKAGAREEAALARAIRYIYEQKRNGITEAMIKSEAQQVRSSVLINAIKGAVIATTGLLSAPLAILGPVFTEGVAAIVESWREPADAYDFFKFCQDYLSAIPKARVAAVNKALAELRSDPSVLTAAEKMADDGTRIQNDQAAEIVTAWTNILRGVGKDPGAAGGVGHNDSKGNPFDSAAPGRLHISGIEIREDFSLNREAASATLKGVPGKASEFFLERTLGSIPVARTLDFKELTSIPRRGAFGVNSNGNTVGYDNDDDRNAKAVFASYHKKEVLDEANHEGRDDKSVIDASWEKGIDDLWKQMKDHRVNEFALHIGG